MTRKMPRNAGSTVTRLSGSFAPAWAGSAGWGAGEAQPVTTSNARSKSADFIFAPNYRNRAPDSIQKKNK